ncbi:MAG: 3-phosphoserine/phosphohydroxythreonine transaminase [Clostridia bacterium]|nr:3-phosphoserine/phosphohydroxythreonine transaminase [Clostridia bacterium]
MDKIYNFSANAAPLPDAVTAKLREQVFNYKGTGTSIMEVFPGTKEYTKILKDTELALRKVMDIPTGYTVLFLESPAAAQYSAIPLNLMSDRRSADYVVTGHASKAAQSEAKKFGDIAIAATSAGAGPIFSTVPRVERSDFRPDADYAYICHNDSIYGTKFANIPDTGSIPLAVDMTSSVLSEPVDFSKIALLLAGGECNIGVPGLTVVIIRGDLLGGCRADAPAMLNYKRLADSHSSEFAPSALGIYIAGQVFAWVDSMGGLAEMKRRSEKRASLIYDFLDGQSQEYYTSFTDKKCRSVTNVVFTTGDAELDRKFIAEAAEAGFINLAGHSSVGGMRASLYNSMPQEGVVALVDFMKKFKKNNPRF